MINDYPTPLQVLERCGLKPEDRVFICLHFCGGYSKIAAYKIAYKSTANGNSAASMASRKMADPEMIEAIRFLKNYYYDPKRRIVR
ncbi:MAG: hypothetical protein RR391_17690 [Chryseobacterium sp.]